MRTYCISSAIRSPQKIPEIQPQREICLWHLYLVPKNFLPFLSHRLQVSCLAFLWRCLFSKLKVIKWKMTQMQVTMLVPYIAENNRKPIFYLRKFLMSNTSASLFSIWKKMLHIFWSIDHNTTMQNSTKGHGIVQLHNLSAMSF